MNLTSIHEDAGFHPWPHSVGQGSSVAMSCGLGYGCSLDPSLLWLWLWLWLWLAAVAPIQLLRPLAWELPYAAGVVLKSKKTNNKNQTKQTKQPTFYFSQFWRLEVQDRDVSRAGFLWGSPPLLDDGHLLAESSVVFPLGEHVHSICVQFPLYIRAAV